LLATFGHKVVAQMVALITGVTGQDGLYLAEFLLNRGYRVVGTVRHTSKAFVLLPKQLQDKVELVAWDMLDGKKIADILSFYQPSEVYNLAAYSSGSGMYDEPVDIGDVNGLAVTRILEAIRKVNVDIRFCQASSREVFGDAVESPQTETTLTNPRSPYGAAKLYADVMVKVYRQRYGIFACSAILFNHESPRRKLEFVTRKITHGAVKIKLGLANKLSLGNMDAIRDWGYAGDYVRAMWLMLQHERADDYILATSEAHSVREFCEAAFDYLDLNYLDYVVEGSFDYRGIESTLLIGNADKARRELGWYPEVRFKELIGMMVDADMKILGSN
jgi:GDPmannose 4,6-dehydratase